MLACLRITIYRGERDILLEGLRTLFAYAGYPHEETDPHWLFLARTREALMSGSPPWVLDGEPSSIAALVSGEECSALRERVGHQLSS